jgi:hypothetical protein
MSETISVNDARKAFQCLQNQINEALEFLETLDSAQNIDLTDDNPVVNTLKIKIGPIPIPECPPIPVLTQGMCEPLVGNVCSVTDSSS